MDSLVTITQIVQNIALSLAVLIGGIWSYLLIRIQRGFEDGLLMDTKINYNRIDDGKFIVFLDILLTNTGNREMFAKRKAKSKGKPIYSTKLETIYESIGVRIKKITQIEGTGIVLDWFSSPYLEAIPNLPNEISLIKDYDDSLEAGTFWVLEPKETNYLGTALVLSPGHYLGRIIFVSENDEYFTRIFQFSISA